MLKQHIFFHLVLLLFFHLTINAQKVKYADETLKLQDHDNIFIAGSFKEQLHVFKDDGLGKIDILVYSPGLAVAAENSLSTGTTGYADIQIIPFSNFYFALLHFKKSKVYRILKVHASGAYEDETENLQQSFPATFLRNTVPWDVRKVANRVFILNQYYDEAKQKLFFRILSLDSSLAKRDERSILLDYVSGGDLISKILFVDTASAYITRNYRQASNHFGQVDIVKYDLLSMTLKTISLSGDKDFFYDGDLSYNQADSSFFLVTRLAGRQTSKASGDRNRYYYVKMNTALEEITPSLMVQLKEESNERMMLVMGNATPFPFGLSGKQQANTRNAITSVTTFDDAGLPSWGAQGVSNMYAADPSSPPQYRALGTSSYRRRSGAGRLRSRLGVDLDRTDLNLRIVYLDGVTVNKKEKIIEATKGKMKSQYNNSFMFHHEGRNFLFFSKSYGLIRNGIGYLSVENGIINDEEFLKVTQENNYLLPLSKKINEHAFVIPYTYKGKLGFVMVSF